MASDRGRAGVKQSQLESDRSLERLFVRYKISHGPALVVVGQFEMRGGKAAPSRCFSDRRVTSQARIFRLHSPLLADSAATGSEGSLSPTYLKPLMKKEVPM